MGIKLVWAGLFLITVLVVYLSVTDITDSQDATRELVRNPIDNTLLSTYKPVVSKKWHFEHCTPTNKNCGRLE